MENQSQVPTSIRGDKSIPVVSFKSPSKYFGKNLTLSGTSSYNTTSNCGVFVIVDGVRPYQWTIPIGEAVGNNYSKWKYTLTPTYAGIIKEGINRITAKLLCKADPVNLTKFYSINVTGVNEIVLKHPMTTRNNTVPVSSNNLSYLFTYQLF